VRQLELKLMEVRSELSNHQRDRLQMLKVMRKLDHSLEQEQQLSKELTKALKRQRKK